MMSKLFFKSTKILDGQEYVSKEELEKDFIVKRSGKLFEKDASGKLRFVGTWKQMFRVEWYTVVIVVMALCTYGLFTQSTKECMSAMENPCLYCSSQDAIHWNKLLDNESKEVSVNPQEIYVKVDINPYDNITNK
jgi:hypothetical protein